MVINWSSVPDSGVAALVASELRRTGQPFSNELMLTRCRSMILVMQDWIRRNEDYCTPIFAALMAHRARIGLPYYNTWDTYVDSVGSPYSGRLDLLQLAAYADIQTVNIRVLAPAVGNMAWAPISWIQPAGGAVLAAGCALAVPLTVGLGPEPHDSFVELLPYPRRRRRTPSSSSSSDAGGGTGSTDDGSDESSDPADRTPPSRDSSADSGSPAPPGRSPHSASDPPDPAWAAPRRSRRVLAGLASCFGRGSGGCCSPLGRARASGLPARTASQLHSWVFATGAARPQEAEDIPAKNPPAYRTLARRPRCQTTLRTSVSMLPRTTALALRVCSPP